MELHRDFIADPWMDGLEFAPTPDYASESKSEPEHKSINQASPCNYKGSTNDSMIHPYLRSTTPIATKNLKPHNFSIAILGFTNVS